MSWPEGNCIELELCYKWLFGRILNSLFVSGSGLLFQNDLQTRGLFMIFRLQTFSFLLLHLAVIAQRFSVMASPTPTVTIAKTYFDLLLSRCVGPYAAVAFALSYGHPTLLTSVPTAPQALTNHRLALESQASCPVRTATKTQTRYESSRASSTIS